jgi:flagellin-like protein
MQKRRGISPVIATVIIVAVTIAVAIAVAFWMTGIVGLFTAAEKVEFVTLYATPTSSGWDLTAIVRNVGTTSTSIDSIFINGVLAATVSGTTATTQTSTLKCLSSISISGDNPMTPGQNATVTIKLTRGDCGVFQAQSGVSIEVKFHTTGGKEYPKLTVLP